MSAAMRTFTVLAGWLLLLTACAPAAPGPGPVVLASTTFLADIAQNVAGDRLRVESLLPAGADPHSFQPTPQDLAKLSDSRVLIVNGADYEHFLEAILTAADGDRLLITAASGLTPRRAGDPHLWLDPTLVIAYVENIRAGLTEADPQGAAVYRSNAQAYAAQLEDLDAWITQQVAQVPAERRLLVTNHEALGYFADRYGFEIAGTVLSSASSAASVSARELSRVIDGIRAAGAPAIFLDGVENPNFARQIAGETGVRVVDDLHLESLTDGGPAGTYIDMMRHNVTRIVDALK